MEFITGITENPLFPLFVQLVPVFLIVVAGPIIIAALFYLRGDM